MSHKVKNFQPPPTDLSRYSSPQNKSFVSSEKSHPPQTTEETEAEAPLGKALKTTEQFLHDLEKQQGAFLKKEINKALDSILKKLPPRYFEQTEKASSHAYKGKMPSSDAKNKQVAQGGVSKTAPLQGPLSPALQTKVMDLISMIESKKNYGQITPVRKDGKSQGIAYGVLQLLSRHGGVDRLIARYAKLGGKYASQLLAFGSAKNTKVADNPNFQKLLKLAAKDPLMRTAQRDIFTAEYLKPALKFAESLGLKSPAAHLVVFDTFIHMGDKKWVRRKLSMFVRKHGEKEGLKKYLDWMKNYLVKVYAPSRKKVKKAAASGATKVKKYKAHKKTSSSGLTRTQRYNAWRAMFLKDQLTNNPQLEGPIKMHSPVWRKPVVVP